MGFGSCVNRITDNTCLIGHHLRYKNSSTWLQMIRSAWMLKCNFQKINNKRLRQQFDIKIKIVSSPSGYQSFLLGAKLSEVRTLSLRPVKKQGNLLRSSRLFFFILFSLLLLVPGFAGLMAHLQQTQTFFHKFLAQKFVISVRVISDTAFLGTRGDVYCENPLQNGL